MSLPARIGQMIHARTKNKYRFNMRVSLRVMYSIRHFTLNALCRRSLGNRWRNMLNRPDRTVHCSAQRPSCKRENQRFAKQRTTDNMRRQCGLLEMRGLANQVYCLNQYRGSQLSAAALMIRAAHKPPSQQGAGLGKRLGCLRSRRSPGLADRHPLWRVLSDPPARRHPTAAACANVSNRAQRSGPIASPLGQRRFQ